MKRRGGRIIEGAKVVSVSRGAGRVRLADGRDVAARHVVVASSGYASTLNLHPGRLIPLHLRVLLTEPLAGAQLEGLGWRGREGVIDSRRVFNYFRLTDDDRILFGGGRPRYTWGGRPADRPAEGPDLDRLVRGVPAAVPDPGGPPHRPELDRGDRVHPRRPAGDRPRPGARAGHLRRRLVRARDRPQRPLGTLGAGADRRGGAAGGLALVSSEPPLAPTEAARWLAVRSAGWAMEMMDRL